MKTSTTCFIFIIIIIVVVSSSGEFSDQSQLPPEWKSNRNPKFLHFLKQFFESYPTTTATYLSSSGFNKGKYGDEAGNYDQYFVSADPYNQNQLLSAVDTQKQGPSLDIAASEHSAQGESSESGINSMNTLFTALIGEDTSSPSSIISNILRLGTGSMEKVLQRVNSFDSLKCIPRLLCQTVAQRQLNFAKVEVTTSTVKPKMTSRFDALPIYDYTHRNGKTIKFIGVETALSQFMAFLDLVQLKNWSLYPYLKGAYEGAQVKRLDECAQRFETCPFSDQQLVYYFNNYNGGFFQNLHSN